ALVTGSLPAMPRFPLTPGVPTCPYTRRQFLRTGAFLATAAPLGLIAAAEDDGDDLPRIVKVVAPPPPSFSPTVKANAKVAIVACKEYGTEVHAAMGKAFDLVGGIEHLVRGKTVTV